MLLGAAAACFIAFIISILVVTSTRSDIAETTASIMMIITAISFIVFMVLALTSSIQQKAEQCGEGYYLVKGVQDGYICVQGFKP
jgi:hypothetical protein